MSEYNRLVELMEKACRFCPVCGSTLELREAKHTIKNSGPADGTFVVAFKACPQGHASLGVDPSWDPRDGRPDAIFELSYELFER